MNDKTDIERSQTLEVLLDDEFISGRINVYRIMLSLLTEKLKEGEALSKIRLLSSFLNLTWNNVHENVITLNSNEIGNLRATNYLDLSDIQKEAYLINLDKFYQEAGYVYSGGYPIDHLIVQLIFLLKLTNEMLGKSFEAKIELLKLQSRFIGTHVLPWLKRAQEEIFLARVCFDVLSLEFGLFREFFSELFGKKS